MRDGYEGVRKGGRRRGGWVERGRRRREKNGETYQRDVTVKVIQPTTTIIDIYYHTYSRRVTCISN